MASFATVADLTDRGVTLTVSEDVATQILSDASEHLRSIVGPIAVPEVESTVTLHIGCGPQWIQIPMRPLASIGSVTLDGVVIDYRRIGDSIRVVGPGVLAITATHGYATAPQELVSWTCVLASQALSTLDDLGAIGAGEVSSIGIDDYRKSFKQMADRGAFTVPQAAADSLAARYGGGAETSEVLR